MTYTSSKYFNTLRSEAKEMDCNEELLIFSYRKYFLISLSKHRRKSEVFTADNLGLKIVLCSGSGWSLQADSLKLEGMLSEGIYSGQRVTLIMVVYI